MTARWLLVALLLSGCLGGEPRRVAQRDPGAERPEFAEPARAARPEPDPWSVDGMLPRSGDPARPNVKVSVEVVDVRSSEGLFVRGAIRGAFVRGVVNLRAALSAGGGAQRARSRATSFIVVQAGSAGSIQLSHQARPLCGGTVQGLWVAVHAAGPQGVRLSLDPYVAPTARRGEQVSGAGDFLLAPGQAAVIGGFERSAASEQRTWGSYQERRSDRSTLVLLTVDVIG